MLTWKLLSSWREAWDIKNSDCSLQISVRYKKKTKKKTSCFNAKAVGKGEPPSQELLKIRWVFGQRAPFLKTGERTRWTLDELWNPVGLCRTPIPTLLLSGYCYIWGFLSALLLCCAWLDFLGIHGVSAKKKNSVHTLEFGITNLLLGRAPNSWSHQVSSSFWLIILPKKPVFHHAEAVKTQVVFSLLGLCWVVRDTSCKTRLLMHTFPGALYLAFNIHIASPWENMWASTRRKF